MLSATHNLQERISAIAEKWLLPVETGVPADRRDLWNYIPPVEFGTVVDHNPTYRQNREANQLCDVKFMVLRDDKGRL